MTRATWPFNMELSNLTIKMRQLHRTRSEKASRMRAAVRSGRFTLTKR